MSQNSLTDAVKEALAKKQAHNLPKNRRSKDAKTPKREVPRAAGAPIRKASGRGG